MIRLINCFTDMYVIASYTNKHETYHWGLVILRPPILRLLYPVVLHILCIFFFLQSAAYYFSFPFVWYLQEVLVSDVLVYFPYLQPKNE